MSITAFELFQSETGMVYKLLPEEVGVFEMRLVQQLGDTETVIYEGDVAKRLFSMMVEGSIFLTPQN